MRDYTEVTYRDKPFTDYPDELVGYLTERYDLGNQGRNVLDVGCGRGEYLDAFRLRGFACRGVDQTIFCDVRRQYIKSFCEECDVETESLPFQHDNEFSIVLIKSVLEHLYHPERVMAEIHRVLKYGGMVIAMTPAFRTCRVDDDYTHRTRFTEQSLRLLLEIAGFMQIHVERFVQSPWVWKRPGLQMPLKVLARLGFQHRNIRNARGYTLLGTGIK